MKSTKPLEADQWLLLTGMIWLMFLYKIYNRKRNIFSPFRYGGTQAATFCCLMTLWHQLHFEGGVDIYQLAKLAHYNRPGVFKHPEDVLFLYW